MTDAVQAAGEALGLSGGLLPVRDVTGRPIGVPTGGGSRPPWNSAAADAHFDLRETIFRLEVSLLNQVEGEKPRQRRGGSDRAADAARRSLGRLAERIESGDADRVARILWRKMGPTERLPAVDTATRWIPIRACGCREECPHRPPACPYCGTMSLRCAEGGFTVMCFGWIHEVDGEGRVRTVPCRDSDGNRPFGALTISELTAEPILAFRDGLVSGPLALGAAGFVERAGTNGGRGVRVA